MRKENALRLFDGNAAALGRAIGVSRVSVRQWGPVIPLEAAFALEIATGGKVKVRPSMYPRLRFAKRIARGKDPNSRVRKYIRRNVSPN